jgi:phage/plasmid primase-like uncharacterized protein
MTAKTISPLRQRMIEDMSVRNFAFAAALSDAGLVLDGPPIIDGALHRVPVEGDRTGARSGAYIGHLDHRPAGFIQNFQTGEKRNWKAETDVPLTAEERAARPAPLRPKGKAASSGARRSTTRPG